MRFVLNSCDYECSSLIQEFEHPTKTHEEFIQDVNLIIDKIVPQMVEDHQKIFNPSDSNSWNYISEIEMAPYIVPELEKIGYIKIEYVKPTGYFYLWYYPLDRRDTIGNGATQSLSKENRELICDFNEKCDKAHDIKYLNIDE